MDKNKIRELIIKAPYLCKCKEPDRVSHIFRVIYDSTVTDGNPFDPLPEDFLLPKHRLKFIDLTSPHWEAKDKKTAKKIMALLTTCMWASWENKGKVPKETSQKVIKDLYPDTQIIAPEVDAILTQEQAASSWWWIS